MSDTPTNLGIQPHRNTSLTNTLNSYTQVWLDGNHITDLSPLTHLPKLEWAAWDLTSTNFGSTASDQSLTATAIAGQSSPLPTVTPLAVGQPVTWSSDDSGVTIKGGTFTVSAPGTVTLKWTDATGYFTGTVTVTATAPSVPAGPSGTPAQTVAGASAATGGTLPAGTVGGSASALLVAAIIVLAVARTRKIGMGHQA